MSRKKRTWLIIALIAVILPAAVFLDPTFVILGWLRGESFYQGKPTSYWSREMRGWMKLSDGWAGAVGWAGKSRWIHVKEFFSFRELISTGRPFVSVMVEVGEPPLLEGDPA